MSNVLALKLDPFCESAQDVFKKNPLYLLSSWVYFMFLPPDTVSCSAMHYIPKLPSLPGFLLLFPLFLSQHDIVINKQLKKTTWHRRRAYMAYFVPVYV